MNQSIFVSGLAVSIIYLIIKFLEMKVILKKNFLLKKYSRCVLYILVSLLVFIYCLNLDKKLLNLLQSFY